MVLFAALLFSCGKNKDEIKRSSIIAKINDKIITLGEFEDYFNFRLARYLEGLNEKQLRDIKYKVLQDMIDEEIILDVAKKEKIDVSQMQIEEEMSRISSQYGDEQEFNTFIRQSGLDTKLFREFLRRNWIIRLVEEQKVYNNINVTSKEILKYYSDNSSDYQHSESVEVRELIFNTLDEAQETYERLKNGEKFDDIYIAATGDLDDGQGKVYTKEELPENISKELFGLKKGKYSEILEDEYGRYHIFKIESKVYAKRVSLSEVEPTIKQIILLQKRELRYSQWINSLKKRSYEITVNENYFNK